MAPSANIFVRLKPTDSQDVVAWKSNKSVVFDRVTTIEEYPFSEVFAEDNLHVFQSLNDYSMATRNLCLVESIYNGVNETIFAYGQTGSGKTHAIFGNDDSEPGLLHMFVQDLFAVKEVTHNADVEIRMRCFEIFGETLVDLIDENLGQHTEIFLKTARYKYQTVVVDNAQDCLQLLFRAEQERSRGETSCNDRSSRSHCVAQFDVLKHEHGLNMYTKGTFTFVDLAGCERAGLTDKTSPKLTRQLNASLSSLIRLFRQLQTGDLRETERRQSVLNKLIFDYVQPSCGIWILFCISRKADHRDYTLSTLQLASDSRNIRLAQQKQTFLKLDTRLVPLSARTLFTHESEVLGGEFSKFNKHVSSNSYDRQDARLADDVLCESLIGELDCDRCEGSTAVPSDDVSSEDYAQAIYRLERKYKELKRRRAVTIDRLMEENKDLRSEVHAERARADSLESLIRSEQNFVSETLNKINKFRTTCMEECTTLPLVSAVSLRNRNAAVTSSCF